jgi:NAD(P) transhydrogenase subunit beta
MDDWRHLLIDFAIILVLIVGIRQFRTPQGARSGNLSAAFALLCALGVVLLRNQSILHSTSIVVSALVAGGLLGWIVAARVTMIQIPAMVAFQHGAGGVAAFLVAFVELTRDTVELRTVGQVSGILGIIIGAATFAGSMIASAKLANLLKQTPVILPKHDWILLGTISVLVALGILAGNITGPALPSSLLMMILISVLLGIVFSIRIGGADMPVLISFLNATAGVAAALCGIIIQNQLLIACGATVAASGSILTHVMCKAMNRNLLKVFVGVELQPKSVPFPRGREEPGPELSWTAEGPEKPSVEAPLSQALRATKKSKTVVIIPGNGMALAHAQFETVRLANRLGQMGKQVKFAIHPVAGRMPGHMHVLLAEAEVDPDMLFDMDEVNDKFKQTDLAVIIGACDVVNPAATTAEGTPIWEMPILKAHEAKQVLVCNLDQRPGYSGVENPLYADPKTILMFGDAKTTVGRLLESLG